jgi:DNA-binding winged helix-turn-helix (wHTH) protein
MLEVWQTTFWTSAKTIDVHLGWLRRKLGDDTRHPTLITTIRGQGLRFELPADTHVDAPADAPSVPAEAPAPAERTLTTPPRLSAAT